MTTLIILRNIFKCLNSAQRMAGVFSLFFFICYWAFANLYWAITFGLMGLGKLLSSDQFVWWNPGVWGMLMAFCTPFWAFTVIGGYSCAMALAAISLRPLPLLLAAVAWSSLNGYLPSGHIQPFKDKADWLYPILFSTLAILAFILNWLRTDNRKSSVLKSGRAS